MSDTTAHKASSRWADVLNSITTIAVILGKNISKKTMNNKPEPKNSPRSRIAKKVAVYGVIIGLLCSASGNVIQQISHIQDLREREIVLKEKNVALDREKLALDRERIALGDARREHDAALAATKALDENRKQAMLTYLGGLQAHAEMLRLALNAYDEDKTTTRGKTRVFNEAKILVDFVMKWRAAQKPFQSLMNGAVTDMDQSVTAQQIEAIRSALARVQKSIADNGPVLRNAIGQLAPPP